MKIEFNKSYASAQWARETEDAPILLAFFAGPLVAAMILHGAFRVPLWGVALIAAAYYSALGIYVLRENAKYNEKRRRELCTLQARMEALVNEFSGDETTSYVIRGRLDRAINKASKNGTLDDKVRWYNAAYCEINDDILHHYRLRRDDAVYEAPGRD